MGTRGLYGFISNGQLKGTYNHYDSYPRGLGKEILEQIPNIVKNSSLNFLKEKIDAITLVQQGDNPTKKQIEFYKKHLNENVGGTEKITWYQLLRELQFGGFVEAIEKNEVKHMIDSAEFIKDSLFCEYAYIINLDTQKLEYYVGFQNIPDSTNKFGTTLDNGYYPCRLVKEYELQKITDLKIDSIVKEMEKLNDKWSAINTIVEEKFKKEKIHIKNLTIEQVIKVLIAEYGSLEKIKGINKKIKENYS